jgi:hypothetical protein
MANREHEPYPRSAETIIRGCEALIRFATVFLTTNPDDVSPTERANIAKAAALVDEALTQLR